MHQNTPHSAINTGAPMYWSRVVDGLTGRLITNRADAVKVMGFMGNGETTRPLTPTAPPAKINTQANPTQPAETRADMSQPSHFLAGSATEYPMFVNIISPETHIPCNSRRIGPIQKFTDYTLSDTLRTRTMNTHSLSGAFPQIREGGRGLKPKALYRNASHFIIPPQILAPKNQNQLNTPKNADSASPCNNNDSLTRSTGRV